MTDRRRARRSIGLSAALVAGAAGVATGNAAIFVASTVGLVYAAYEAATRDPEPVLTVERTLEPAAPLPGEAVAVTVTVSNDGLGYLPDVRVVDGVPERLRVVAGSPRFGTALDADDSASFTYAVEARRGDHPFGETTVVCRDLTGTGECRQRVRVETTVECSADVESLPLSAQTLPRAGRVPTRAGGDGVSFYAVREYQSTDPMARIDWNRFARTSELATVEFRETAAASVVLLVDTRNPVSPRPRAPSAVQFAVYAAERIGATLLAEDNRVGAATFDDGAYLRPAADRAQRRRLREFFGGGNDGDSSDGEDGEFLTGVEGGQLFQSVSRLEQYESERHEPGREGGGAAPDGGDVVGTLDRTLPDGAQVVFCTPLLDDRAADAAKRLAAHGHSVTVLSPDVTTDETPGGTLAGFDRAERLDGLRPSVRVVDWTPTDPLATALLRAESGWSA
ncbi:DUF58 domain-containing protein [Halomicroarcula limicola]|uniref:DUF58 domain-containing protein n=1 Tax=Haloarcula limicola TaxID=1429915 RepID=A0A8J7Y9R4_9EURY|nr:DUF58 domain-containing protein [Halomicroarcula limicola]MBV0923301.1 DUF58 domain-containing protein [Halomicroarcula limicola]